MQIELLLRQIDGAGGLDVGFGRGEFCHARLGHPLAHREIGDRALQLDFLVVTEQLGDHHGADVERGQIQQLAAQGAVAHIELEFARAAAQQLGDGVALRAERDRAIHLAQAFFHERDLGEQRRELEPLDRALDLALQRFLVAVEHHHRIELALGDAEAQRFQAQYAVLQNGMGAQRVDGQVFRAHDMLAVELDVEVHCIPATDVERVVGQDAATRGPGFLCLGFGGAQHGHQVGQAQLFGAHVADELGARLARGVGEVAFEVAAADLAAEVFILPDRFTRLQAAGQVAAGVEGRRVGQHQSRERVEIGHAEAFERDVEVQAR